jgi:sugar/nucleoside kinase (ribokinase family)
VSTSPRLFCLDTVMIDIVMRISSIPKSGSDVLASQHLLTTGGGYNAMSSAARQGLAVSYAGRLGTGPFSTIASASLDRDGVVHCIVPNPDLDNGFCVALVDPEGERTFITSRGAEGTLRSSDLAELQVRPGDYVLLSGYNFMDPLPSEVILSWLGDLADDVVVTFDPSNRVRDIPQDHLDAVLARADWMVCNEYEAVQLVGGATPGESAIALAEMTGRRGVVVRHGATGCTVALDDDLPVTVAGFATDVVDTNGAGDTHNGVLLAELAHGVGPLEAARRANAAAAIAISQFGPATCPSRDAIDQWIESREMTLGVTDVT